MMSDSSPMISRALLEVMSPEALRIHLRTLRRGLEDETLPVSDIQALEARVYLVNRRLKEVKDG